MSTRKLILVLGLACTLGADGAFAQTPGLGKPIPETDGGQRHPEAGRTDLRAEMRRCATARTA